VNSVHEPSFSLPITPLTSLHPRLYASSVPLQSLVHRHVSPPIVSAQIPLPRGVYSFQEQITFSRPGFPRLMRLTTSIRLISVKSTSRRQLSPATPIATSVSLLTLCKYFSMASNTCPGNLVLFPCGSVEIVISRPWIRENKRSGVSFTRWICVWGECDLFLREGTC